MKLCHQTRIEKLKVHCMKTIHRNFHFAPPHVLSASRDPHRKGECLKHNYLNSLMPLFRVPKLTIEQPHFKIFITHVYLLVICFLRLERSKLRLFTFYATKIVHPSGSINTFGTHLVDSCFTEEFSILSCMRLSRYYVGPDPCSSLWSVRLVSIHGGRGWTNRSNNTPTLSSTSCVQRILAKVHFQLMIS